jgi:hypothetical protein
VLSIDPGLTYILASIDGKLNELNHEKDQIVSEIQSFDEENFSDPERFKEFCFYVLEHMTELVHASQNFEEIRTLFRFVFKETPTYDQIVNRTAPIYPIFAITSQQKNSREGIFEKNLNWQGGSGSN